MSQQPATMSAAKLSLLAARARAEAGDTSLAGSEPIAIVGIGCRLPGGIASPADYWAAIRAGVDAIDRIPADRWDADAYHDDDPYAPGKMNTRRGGFLRDIDQFDPTFFGLSPREASAMDPQQRLVLEVAWEALWDAGIAPRRLAGSATGVFVAVYNSDYARLSMSDEQTIGSHTCAGISHSMASGRISFLLDLRGPSISVDTACSSSLVAVHLSCQSLRAGDCRAALAGGVSIKIKPGHHLSLSKLGMLSPDGQCRTFDAGANGFVAGDGCGVIVLKKLADAIADGDRIHAVIRGTAVNQDGRTSVITAPNGRAQQEVVRAALANARVRGADVTYVETHGTGTALGDPIEVDALTAALQADGAGPCALGAVKSNVGHLEAASGIIGLIKAALALEHEEIPANLHFDALNPHIDLTGSRLFVPTQAVAWPRAKTPRFAGVSSFGFSGTNAHAVLEEAPLVPGRPLGRKGSPAAVLLISGHTPEALRASMERYRQFLDSADALGRSVDEIGLASATRRDAYAERLAIVGESHDELRARLDESLAGRAAGGVVRGRASIEAPPLAFVFSGQGSQWATMGRQLLESEPVFRTLIDECDRLLKAHVEWSLVDVLSADESASPLGRTQYAQPSICALEIALARLLDSWGIRPALVIGHSAGEVAAAHVSGLISLPEAMRLIAHRGLIMQRATGLGCMAAVALPAADVMATVERAGGAVSVAAVNGPRSTVVSGDREMVESLMNEWRAHGVDVRQMPVDYAFHSAQMDRLLPDLEHAFGNVVSTSPAIPMVSSVTGLDLSSSQVTAAYWTRAVRRPVLFRQAVDAALGRGIRCFVEIGPHPVLSASVAECAESVEGGVQVVPTLRRGRPERPAMMATVAGLFAAGCAPKWELIYGGRGPVVTLPAYPFQRERCWLATIRGGEKPAHRASGDVFEVAPLDSPAIHGRAWETSIDLAGAPFLADHRIAGRVVFPLAGFIELAMRAARAGGWSLPLTLRDITVREPLFLDDDGQATVQVTLEDGRLGIFSRREDGWGQHLSAVLVEDGEAAMPLLAAIGQAALVDADSYYAALRERQIDYGPAFQGIRTLRSNDVRVQSEVSLPDGAAVVGSSWILHPVTLDACLQTILAAADNDGLPYMPIAIDALTVHQPAPRDVLCNLELRRAAPGNTETRSAHIAITTAAGAPVATLSGFHVKRVPHHGSEAPSRIFELQWIADAPTTSERRVASALIVGGSVAAIELTTALKSRGVDVERRTFDDVDEATLSRHTVLVVEAASASGARAADDPIAEQDAVCRLCLDLSQRIVRRTGVPVQETWFVTRNAHRVLENDRCEGFPDATVWGLSRTLALEHPMVRWVRADVDETGASLDALVDAIIRGAAADETAFRVGQVYVPKLSAVDASGRGPMQLVVHERGSIDNLQHIPLVSRPIGSRDVEVSVEATALNFRDVLNALGAYPGDPGPLGLEFCGRVTAVGSEVSRVSVGDRVAGISWGSLADMVVADMDLVTQVPGSLTAEEAVTLPNAFATAYHCLIEVAGLSKGERVLIHAATGGVGLMAVRIAQHVGAQVFATAGSDEKRAFLRAAGVAHVFDSRSLTFARNICDTTGGVGVDVVLNSLAGEFIASSLSVTREGGRFVEIGKTGVWSSEEVAKLGHSIAYSVVDIGVFVDREPMRIAGYFEQMNTLLVQGAIQPLPRATFRFEDARTAFRFMEHARHVGKVVLRHRAARALAPVGTWLLIGGLGALGLELAGWLASQGVTRLILLGRRTPVPEITGRLNAIREAGVQVDVRAIDLTSAGAEAALDAVLSASPVAGIVHLAGVLDDGVVDQQNWARFKTVFAPKVDGGWMVHRLAKRHGVPQVVLYSSVASLMGSSGQSGYAAANAFLDGLAAYRTAHGQPTLTINWGVWGEAGMAAKLEAAGKRRGLDLLTAMSPAECLAALTPIFTAGAQHAAVFATERPETTTAATARLDALLPPTAAARSATTSPSVHARPIRFGETLAGVPRSRGRKLVVEHLRDETRLVLGLTASHIVDEQQPLMKMGLDSLMALELRNRLAASFGRSMSATMLFDYPTIGQLADFLLPEEQRPVETARDKDFEDIAALSDEEADRLLAEELDASSGH
jgi:acyl transferase domain-containing protein/D-arabinose 1-dehydrogenase-like Zn-dependent alcohol dehydrogenase/aryl carrier-like protein